MEDRERRYDGRAAAPAADDRGRTTGADMEIVRSLGGALVARLLRRDQESRRRQSGRAAR